MTQSIKSTTSLNGIPAESRPPTSADQNHVPASAAPPSQTSEEKRFFRFWRQSLTPLEKQAQLSAVYKTVNWGYRGFWGMVSLPYRVISKTGNWIGGKVAEKVTLTATARVIESLVAPEQTALRNLRNCLHQLSQRVSSKIEIGTDLRTQTATAIDDFLLNQKEYLKECIDPASGLTAGIDYQQEKNFDSLSRALKANDLLDGFFIKSLFAIIEKYCTFQQSSHVNKKAKQLWGRVQPTAPTAASAAQLTVKKTTNRAYEGLNPAPPRQAPPKNRLSLIKNEINVLKSVAFKIILAHLILPESSLHKSDEQNGGLLAALIDKSVKTLDPLKDSNEIFQNLLFTELDNSNLNFVQRTWKKFICRILAPPLMYLTNHVLEKSEEGIFYLIGVSPEERLRLIVKMFIEPGYEFICKLQTE
jgi:hypothetical protein